MPMNKDEDPEICRPWICRRGGRRPRRGPAGLCAPDRRSV